MSTRPRLTPGPGGVEDAPVRTTPMTKQRLFSVLFLTAIFVVGLAHSARMQTAQSRAVSAVGATPYTPPKTPWGDPDLQGTYTNKDENGIPMERPSQFEGKKLEEVDDSSEFADIVRERNERALATAAGIGGRDTGAGPVHWYEHYNAKNSCAWMITDPPDGRIPPLTPAAQKAATARTAAAAARRASGHGDADSWEDRSLYDRCITRGIQIGRASCRERVEVWEGAAAHE